MLIFATFLIIFRKFCGLKDIEMYDFINNITELLIKSYISISFICFIFTPENFNIQTFDELGLEIYLEQSNPNLFQIPFLKFSKISHNKVISNFK